MASNFELDRFGSTAAQTPFHPLIHLQFAVSRFGFPAAVIKTRIEFAVFVALGGKTYPILARNLRVAENIRGQFLSSKPGDPIRDDSQFDRFWKLFFFPLPSAVLGGSTHHLILRSQTANTIQFEFFSFHGSAKKACRFWISQRRP